MKIALLHVDLPNDSRGGVAHQVHAFANALCQRGHKVKVFSGSESYPECHYTVHSLGLAGYPRRIWPFIFAWKLRQIDFAAYDVVHAFGDNYLLENVHPQIRTFSGTAKAEAASAKTLRRRLYQSVMALLETRAGKIADLSVGISESTKRGLPQVSKIVPCGVDLADFSVGPKSSHPSILFVGTLGGRKRGRLLLEIFRLFIRPRVPECQLWMVMDEAIEAPGVTCHVRIPTEQLSEMYRAAWLFCMPSVYEGFGVPYLEAMASGTAVVASNNPGAREVLGDGRFGKIVPDEEMGATIVALLGNATSREEMARDGLLRAQRYAWPSICAEYEGLYEQVAEPSRRTSAYGSAYGIDDAEPGARRGSQLKPNDWTAPDVRERGDLAVSEPAKAQGADVAAKPLRLAWVGDAADCGGVPGLCRLFVQGLAAAEVELHWFTRSNPAAISGMKLLGEKANVRFHYFPFSWNWESWYGRNRKLAFVVGLWRRAGAFKKLARALVSEHRREPFDAIVQFSQAELIGLRGAAQSMPLLLFPCVHAQGELDWCRKEEALAKLCEPWWWRRFRAVWLAYRAQRQRKDYALTRGIIGLSQRFNGLISRDYNIPVAKTGVIYHPISLEKMRWNVRSPDHPLRLLYVGRISVRKGIEVLLAALPAIQAENDNIELVIIGEGDQWSSYEPLLKALPKAACRWLKNLPHDRVVEEMEQGDVLLAPSSYEPGGIVVAEALACGMILAASEEVGSAEGLQPPVSFDYPARDPAALASAVRRAVAAVRMQGTALRAEARKAAEGRFSSARAIADLLTEARRLTA